jgi:hypothetical protein
MLRLKITHGNRKGTMRHNFFSFTLFFFALSLNATELNLQSLPYKKNVKEKILDGDVFSESKVQSQDKTQSLKFSIAGLHAKSCDYAMKKLSLYENYHQFLNFVKESKYNSETKELNFLLSHALLPYDMRLIFNLDRIKGPGTYPFRFDIGILKDLTGTIQLADQSIRGQKRCLIYTTANWSGPHTGFPNFIFESFSQALASYSMERLFRLSSTLSH